MHRLLSCVLHEQFVINCELNVFRLWFWVTSVRGALCAIFTRLGDGLSAVRSLMVVS